MTEKRELDKRDWIAGLDKGIRIIEAFNDAHPRLTASTAARRTGITRTAARRYLRTLEHLGYVESDGQMFWLTPRVLRLGWSYFDSAKLPRAVQPYLQRIAVALGGATYYAVLDETDVVFVARDGSSQIQNVGFVLGARVSANLAAAGIAMLAYRPKEEVDAWLAGRKFVPYTQHTATTADAVRENIDNARVRGYALLEQQLAPSVRGIAVAIRKRDGTMVGSISVSLPMGTETSERAVARSLPYLREAEYALMSAF
ncbi:IclR family transcriptional regulator domain-containing protein [Propionivibrio soli]|jgi:IclR family pca regulon transcriptional regulator|uniref:IclR family transcriptional regulator domain-containing protein n=1 Tax=Propionivibrio soli TaxID=2976531 RepID=UPI0021E82956|nr:IclR family transcriptional regulator C-terminal domain-containing protein [Propionivibrio soli]